MKKTVVASSILGKVALSVAVVVALGTVAKAEETKAPTAKEKKEQRATESIDVLLDRLNFIEKQLNLGEAEFKTLEKRVHDVYFSKRIKVSKEESQRVYEHFKKELYYRNRLRRMYNKTLDKYNKAIIGKKQLTIKTSRLGIGLKLKITLPF